MMVLLVLERSMEFISIFKTELKPNITSETNLKIVNFLDVTLNFNTKTYEPYKKPNNNPLHININSNHQSNIIKNLPENIQKKNKLSSNTRIFSNSKGLYNALSPSDFNLIKVIPQQHQTKTEKGT